VHGIKLPRHIIKVSHLRHVEPAIRHSNHNIGGAELQTQQDISCLIAGRNRLPQQVFTRDATIHFAGFQCRRDAITKTGNIRRASQLPNNRTVIDEGAVS